MLAGAICTAGPAAEAQPTTSAPPPQQLPPPAAGSAGDPAPAMIPFSWRQLRAAGGCLGDRELLLETGAMGAVALLVSPQDDAWTEWMVEEQPLGENAEDIGYQIGHRRTQMILVGTLTLGGLVSGSVRVRDTGLLLAQAHLVSAGLTQVLKEATDRERPDGGDNASFPSGHAVSAWVMAEVLQRRHGWWIGVPAFAAAIYTGASRVQGNRHHPSDVIAGFALGHWISAAVCRSVEPAAEQGVGLRWLPPALGPSGELALVQARF
jgi:hypothetical protein